MADLTNPDLERDPCQGQDLGPSLGRGPEVVIIHSIGGLVLGQIRAAVISPETDMTERGQTADQLIGTKEIMEMTEVHTTNLNNGIKTQTKPTLKRVLKYLPQGRIEVTDGNHQETTVATTIEEGTKDTLPKRDAEKGTEGTIKTGATKSTEVVDMMIAERKDTGMAEMKEIHVKGTAETAHMKGEINLIGTVSTTEIVEVDHNPGTGARTIETGQTQ